LDEYWLEQVRLLSLIDDGELRVGQVEQRLNLCPVTLGGE